jgi:hypothetical protein
MERDEGFNVGGIAIDKRRLESYLKRAINSVLRQAKKEALKPKFENQSSKAPRNR